MQIHNTTSISKRVWNKLKNIIMLLFFITAFSSLSAQIYPIEVSTVIQPPYPLSLASYADPSSNKINVTIQMLDMSKETYDVHIRLVIKGPSNSTIETNPDTEIGSKIYTIQKGVPLRLSSAELADMFKPENLLPAKSMLNEGFYTFHFEVYDVNRNIRVSNPYVGMQSAWIAMLEPPFLVSPSNGAIVEPKFSKTTASTDQIRFTWAPRVIPPQDASIIYKLNIYEISPDMVPSKNNWNPQDIIASSGYTQMETFETRGTQIILNDGFHSFLLTPGNWYAYQIQIMDEEKITQYKNNGFSTVGAFYYGEGCGEVPALNVLSSGNRKVTVFFTQKEGMDYELQYREKDKMLASWQSVMHVVQGQEIVGLSYDKEYEFRLRGFCNAGYTDFSDIISLTSKGENAISACIPPMGFTVEQKKNADGNKLNISWDNIPNALSYIVKLKSEDSFYTQETNAESMDFNNVKGLEYNNIEINIGMKCRNDGFYVYGEPIAVDLSNGTFEKTQCMAPSDLHITASYNESSKITVLNWAHDNRYKGYRIKYRELESKEAFKEINSTQPPVSVRGCKPNTAYECIINYTCEKGGSIEGKATTFIVEPIQGTIEPKGSCYPPENINGYISDAGKLHILWDKEFDAQGYQVQWNVEGESSWESKESGLAETYITHLKDNKTYSYRIRSLCADSYNFSEWGEMHKVNSSNVYKEPKHCPAPINNTVTVANSSDVYITLEQNNLYTALSVEYRLWNDMQWIQAPALIDNKTILTGLKENTLYEYRVKAYCGSISSEYSAFDTLRTLPKFTLKENGNTSCGTKTSFWINENALPLKSLNIGDVIHAVGWELTITNISGSGVFNGEAIASLPFFGNATAFFSLKDAVINKNKELIDGKVTLNSISHKEIAKEVADILTENSSILMKGFSSVNDAIALSKKILKKTNYAQATKNIDLNPYAGLTPVQKQEKGYALLYDAIKGIALSSNRDNAFANHITNLREGIAVLEKAIEEDSNNDLTVASESSLEKAVLFSENENDNFGLDFYDKKYSILKNQYEPIFMPDANNVYYQAWKSSMPNRTGKVNISFPNKGAYSFKADGISITEDNMRPLGIVDNIRTIEVTYPAGTIELSGFLLQRKNNRIVNSLTGKLRLCEYNPKENVLVIVPVNESIVPFKAKDIANELNSIYSQALAYWNVEIANNINVSGVNKPEDFIINNNSLAYASSMNKIIDEYAEQNSTSQNVYYVFYTAGGTEESAYMPKNNNFGFLFSDKVNTNDFYAFSRTIAQALGHGAYTLSYSNSVYNEFPNGGANNLMGPKTGTSLYKYQWDRISKK